MPEIQPTPEQTLAVLLGASIYRYAPRLARGPAFYNSSQQFAQYLTDSMGVPEENVASFFDDGRSAGDQLWDIQEFIDQRTAKLKNDGTSVRDLIVHYVGHGLFSGGENDYCLAIRTTDDQNEGFTSIRIRDLAAVIRRSAAFVRKYLILDCCFSAAAYTQFQSGPLNVVQVKVRDVLKDDGPQRGTTLLCSASAKNPSIAPRGLPRTMFSDSLLTVLAEGNEAFGPRLSLSDLGELVRLRIKETFSDKGVRPEVHSPDQGSGDVARVPIFPNPAWVSESVRSNSKQTAPIAVAEAQAAAEQMEREEAAQRQAEARAAAEQMEREEAAKRQAEAQAAAEQMEREEAAKRQAEARAAAEQMEREEAAKRQAEARAAAEQTEREEATKRQAEFNSRFSLPPTSESRIVDYLPMMALLLFAGSFAVANGNVAAEEMATDGSGASVGGLVITSLLIGGIGAFIVHKSKRYVPIVCAVLYFIGFEYKAATSTPHVSPTYGLLFDAIALGVALLGRPKRKQA